ncbi:MAG: replication initiation protein [Burkholderiales bacterium]|nr:replication initiation protein [Burkholderiales bacterium]
MTQRSLLPRVQIGLWNLPDESPAPYRKAVQIVHSKPMSNYSLVQRKLTNVWLKNAAENPPDAEGFFSIAFVDMMADMGYEGNNREHVKASARALMRVAFEWDVLAPDGRPGIWEASVLFPSVSIDQVTVRYQISPQLKALIRDPAVYALIDMNSVRKFRRAISVALYEYCIRFERLGRTKALPWRDVRDMLLYLDKRDEDSSAYGEYKYFYAKVLKPAMAEISSVSEISVDLEVTKHGRAIDKLVFLVRRIPSANEAVAHIDNERDMVLVGELVSLKIPQSEALKLLQQHGNEHVQAAFAYTKKRMADKTASKLEHPAAYFRSAVQKGWADSQSGAPAGAKSVKAAASQASQKESLEAAYMLEMHGEAEAYFTELDPAEQGALIDSYNASQDLASLQLSSKKKPGRAAKSAFLGWLVVDTWGKPTIEQLLAFASKRFFANSK